MDEELWHQSMLGHRFGGTGPGQRRQRQRGREHLGRRLLTWRRDNGLTQEQVHDKLGLVDPVSRAGNLEVAKIPWYPHEVEALADVLGVEVDELLREAMHAGDPVAQERREAVIAYALTMDRKAWEAIVAEVERRRA